MCLPMIFKELADFVFTIKGAAKKSILTGASVSTDTGESGINLNLLSGVVLTDIATYILSIRHIR